MTAAIEFRDVSRVFGDVRAVDDVSFAIEPGEFFAMLGPFGLGQDFLPAARGGFRLARPRAGVARRAGRLGRAAVRAQRQHGLPGLRAVPAHDRARERRVRSARARRGCRRLARSARARCSSSCSSARRASAGPRSSRAGSGSASRWRARLINQPEGVAARRAARRARPQAARGNADRAQEPAAPARHHLRLRDARSGRSAVDGGPRRGVQQGQDRAARGAARAVHAARHRIRGAFRRQRERGGRRTRAGHRRIGRARSPSARKTSRARASCAGGPADTINARRSRGRRAVPRRREPLAGEARCGRSVERADHGRGVARARTASTWARASSSPGRARRRCTARAPGAS